MIATLTRCSILRLRCLMGHTSQSSTKQAGTRAPSSRHVIASAARRAPEVLAAGKQPKPCDPQNLEDNVLWAVEELVARMAETRVTAASFIYGSLHQAGNDTRAHLPCGLFLALRLLSRLLS